MRLSALVATAVAVAGALAPTAAADDTVRFATFNASLNRATEGMLVDHLSHPEVDDVSRRQMRNVAEVIQRERPDVVLINEFDFDPGRGLTCSATTSSRSAQNGAGPIDYRYRYVAPSNTGIASGNDLNNNGTSSRPRALPGTATSVRLRRLPRPVRHGRLLPFPISPTACADVPELPWADMPGARSPTIRSSPPDDGTRQELRSSACRRK